MSDQAMKAEFADRIDRLNELVEAERELRAAMSNFEEAQRAVVQSAERLQERADRWADCRQRVLSVVADEDLTPQKATEYKLFDADEVMRRFCDEVELKRQAIAALSVPEVAEVEIPEGFTGWLGDTFPEDVSRDADVEILLRSGGGETGPAIEMDWEHSATHTHPNDIIAYRVLPIEPAAEAKGEEEPEEAECAPPTEGLIEKMERLIRERDAAEDPTAVAIAAYIEAEQADYPDLTDEQDAAIESATAEYQSTDGAEIVSGEPWSIASSSQHAEESALAQSLPPLFPPEREQPATPESLRAGGIVDSEASWWARKLAKEPA